MRIRKVWRWGVYSLWLGKSEARRNIIPNFKS